MAYPSGSFDVIVGLIRSIQSKNKFLFSSLEVGQNFHTISFFELFWNRIARAVSDGINVTNHQYRTHQKNGPTLVAAIKDLKFWWNSRLTLFKKQQLTKLVIENSCYDDGN